MRGFGGSRRLTGERGNVPSRRALLIGAGLTGGTAMLAGGGAAGATPSASDAPPIGNRWQTQPFYGAHQSGILNPQPPATIVVAFDVLAEDRAGLQKVFQALTARIAFLTTGGPAGAANPLLPPLDTGMLGPEIAPDNLTVTVSVGASLFDQRFGLAGVKPKQLIPMERFPNDALDASYCHGDLLIQFSANTSETTLHALRDIVKNTPGLLAIRWKMDGFLPADTLTRAPKATNRNLMGFKDGTANIDTGDAGAMDRLVWTGTRPGEPAWTQGGSYQVVRLIRMTAERWDRTPLNEQQQIMGRDKVSGAPLGMASEADIPDYSPHAQGATIPTTAHIRLANPRTAATAANLILRRPFNYSRELTKAGQLDMGLLFVCYQADLDAGFRAVQARLNGEPLEEYIKPFGGGYFFVLPGVTDNRSYLAKALVERGPA